MLHIYIYIYIYICFVFFDDIIVSRLHSLTISDHAQVTLQTEGLSDVVQSFFFFLAGTPLLGSPKTFYHPGPNPLSAGPYRITSFYVGTVRKVCRAKYWWEYKQSAKHLEEGKWMILHH